jgi:hypothetical protein
VKTLLSIAVICIASYSAKVVSDEAFPRSEALVTAQAELDAIRSSGTRSEMDSATKARLDAALKRRDAELDRRNAEWHERDSTSMFTAQMKACDTARQSLGAGAKISDHFEELRYAGFSTDETLDILLHISYRTPEVGKSVKVAFCILGLPTDTIRRESKDSRTVMFVYPSIFVHAEDGVVTAWSDR